MNRIVAYATVTRFTAPELVSEMTRLIAEGWQPLGSVSVTLIIRERMYVQAVVKYEKRDAVHEMKMM